jgi:rhomboid protease GluP
MDLSMGLLFARLPAPKAHTYRLVLSASRIPHQIIRQQDGWAVDVPDSHRKAATAAIALYLDENAAVVESAPVAAYEFQKSYSAFYALIILWVIHGTVQTGHEQQVFISAYAADSAAILNGQIYRCVTALLFHGSWSHLISNSIGLALFGTAAASVCGGGVGWLMILVAAALGNLSNALWYGPGHLSIGASTAVFAAVGLCSILTFGIQIRRPQHSWRAWVPLGGGLALLAFLGAAPQTDLLAHLFGFGVSLFLGGLYVWLRYRPWPWPVQLAAWVVTISLLGVSWVAGMPSM